MCPELFKVSEYKNYFLHGSGWCTVPPVHSFIMIVLACKGLDMFEKGRNLIRAALVQFNLTLRFI